MVFFSICLIVLYFSRLILDEHRRGVHVLFYIYKMASFNYDAKEGRDAGVPCRCHLSNSQRVSSAYNIINRTTYIQLCVNLCIYFMFMHFVLCLTLLLLLWLWLLLLCFLMLFFCLLFVCFRFSQGTYILSL